METVMGKGKEREREREREREMEGVNEESMKISRPRQQRPSPSRILYPSVFLQRELCSSQSGWNTKAGTKGSVTTVMCERGERIRKGRGRGERRGRESSDRSGGGRR